MSLISNLLSKCNTLKVIQQRNGGYIDFHRKDIDDYRYIYYTSPIDFYHSEVNLWYEFKNRVLKTPCIYCNCEYFLSENIVNQI